MSYHTVETTVNILMGILLDSFQLIYVRYSLIYLKIFLVSYYHKLLLE